MPLKVDSYLITARFARLFPDPAVFDEPENSARRYLVRAGLSNDKASYIHQAADDVEPVDDLGRPATVSGSGRFRFGPRMITADYMTNASIRVDYVDFGSGLSPVDHANLWKKQKWGELNFELRNFQHSSQTINIPEINELYGLLKKQLPATALSTIELPGLSDKMFQLVTSYLRSRLGEYAVKDSLDMELYAARDLSASEKTGLEKRLTRESTKNTIYVILSKSVAEPEKNQ